MQGLEGEGERASQAVGPGSQRAGTGQPLALGLRSGEQGGRAPGSRFPFAQPGEASAPVAWEAGKWRAALVFEPLFSGEKGNDGRGQSSRCSRLVPPALPQAAGQFQAQVLMPLILWLCAGPSSHSPSRCCPLCH